MADGILDGISNAVGGVGDFFLNRGRYADPNAINPQFGVPEADVRQAGINTLANVSALLLAAGQPMSGSERAKLLAGIGPALGGMQTDIFKASQARLMTAQQRTAMEEARGLARLGQKMKDNPQEIADLLGTDVRNVLNMTPSNVMELMKKRASVDPMQKRLTELQVSAQEQLQKARSEVPALLEQDTSLSPAQRAMIQSNPQLWDEYIKSKIQKPDTATSDYKNYQVVAQQAAAAGQPVPTFSEYMRDLKKAGAQTLTIGGSPLVKGITENILATSQAAEGAANNIRAVQSARSEFDQGIVAGITSPVELQIRKVLTAFGVDDPKVPATEAFRTQMAPIILGLVRQLGSGTAISNTDLQFAKDAAGGNITLDAKSISRVLDITERASREILKRSNDRVKRGLSRDPEAEKYSDYLLIEEPPPYTAPSRPATGGARPAAPLSGTAGGLNWRVEQ
jgi:hypothetical protein